MMDPARRNLLVLAGIVAVIYGARSVPWDALSGAGPDYVALDDLPPFRRLETGGEVSAGLTESAVLVGLDSSAEDAALRRARANEARKDICGALFGPDVPRDVVPIAYFSEFRCPYCRVLERDLDDLLVEQPDMVRLYQHELPIFGPPSELAARASLAAARQGRQQALRRRFMRTALVADRAAIQRTVEQLGMDADRFLRDMDSPAVQAQLDRTRALADVFGFIGTPGLVVGRTVLNGAISSTLLRRIVEDERSMPTPVC